jgi:hypothetical protein
MTDQTTPAAEAPPQERATPEELRIRSEHKQQLARIDYEHELEMAKLDRQNMRRMPISLRLLFDRRLREVVERAAQDMAGAGAFAPKHLQNNPQACAVVITRAVGWNLDPYSVAMATYVTPDGKIAFEGKLYRAIAEASGELSGPIRFEYYGNWDQLPRPRFRMVTKHRTNGSEYQAPEALWEYYSEVESGLGVKIIGKLHTGEEISIDFDLIEAHPRNATTWPTRPKTQILQPAIRSFVNNVRPSLLMGVPFREDIDEADMGEPEMRELNPRPQAAGPEGEPERRVYPAPRPVDLREAIKADPEPDVSRETIDPESGEVTEGAPQPAEQQQEAAPQATITVMGKPYVRLGSALNAVEGAIENAPLESLRQNAVHLREVLEKIRATGRDVGDLPEALARRLTEAGPAPQERQNAGMAAGTAAVNTAIEEVRQMGEAAHQASEPAEEPRPGSFEHWVETMERQAAGAPTAGVLSAYRKGRLAEAAVYQNHDEAVAAVERIFGAELQKREAAEAKRAERMGG